MNKLTTAIFTALALGITVAAPVSAHQGATGIVKERMDQMDIMKKSMKSMSAMFKGKAPYDADAVRQHSQTIAKHSDTTLTELFPEGSLQHASEAKPVIWQKWDKFEFLSAELKRVSEALENAADTRETDGGDATMSMSMDTAMMTETAAGDTADSLFRELADTCSSCHTTFRKKKK